VGVLALAVAGMAWTATRPAMEPGPVEYDVGLPDEAPMAFGFTSGLAVAPGGDFVVYESVREGISELWYRSLRDATSRRIEGTTGGAQPAISPDGRRVAFLRVVGDAWTVEHIPVDGGTPILLGAAAGGSYLQWQDDGRILFVEGDGTQARWFDPAGAGTTTAAI
jgi:hypothetical protein